MRVFAAKAAKNHLPAPKKSTKSDKWKNMEIWGCVAALAKAVALSGGTGEVPGWKREAVGARKRRCACVEKGSGAGQRSARRENRAALRSGRNRKTALLRCSRHVARLCRRCAAHGAPAAGCNADAEGLLCGKTPFYGQKRTKTGENTQKTQNRANLQANSSIKRKIPP